MQTNIHANLINRPEVREADDILRSCVHCGFCTAVCPTYQTLGDELDGPRGRIYLIKNLLEDDGISAASLNHLDRCLTCRACETACPSGVKYGRLLDIGREIIAERYSVKPDFQRFRRTFLSWLFRLLIPRQKLFSSALFLGQLVRPIMPGFLAKSIPPKAPVKHYPVKLRTDDTPKSKVKRVLLLQGCVQKAATPNVNNALEFLLRSRQIEPVYLANEGCCGALDYHLSAHENAITKIKDLIDKLFDQLDSVDFILSSASGCGVTIKDYPSILKYDAEYAEKASKVALKVRDVAEFMLDLDLKCKPVKVAVHTPCSLQHGQKLPDCLEQLLSQAGAQLVVTGEKHLCCGSAGTYSILQPSIAKQLTDRKITQLTNNSPEIIVTANVGCQLQLGSNTNIPVQHWVEFMADNLNPVS